MELFQHLGIFSRGFSTTDMLKPRLAQCLQQSKHIIIFIDSMDQQMRSIKNNCYTYCSGKEPEFNPQHIGQFTNYQQHQSKGIQYRLVTSSGLFENLHSYGANKLREAHIDTETIRSVSINDVLGKAQLFPLKAEVILECSLFLLSKIH